MQIIEMNNSDDSTKCRLKKGFIKITDLRFDLHHIFLFYKTLYFLF